MKVCKYLFSVLFVFFSNYLYAQILVPSDIDVFINGVLIFNEISNNDNNDKFGKYSEQVLKIQEIGIIILENDGVIDNDTFNTIQMEWQKFLEIKVPRELEDIFNEMGWNNNGHKKIWTIALGIVISLISERYELPKDAILLNLLDENDMKIIKEKKHELIKMLELM